MQLTARSLPRDRSVRIKGSVMDLYSRRPGMFENSRSSGMWPAEAPSAVAPPSFLLALRPCEPLLSAVDVTRTPTYHPLLAPPFFHDPPFTRRTAEATSLAPQIVA